MARPILEVADILDRHGDAYLDRYRGTLSLGQMKAVSAIRACRTAVMGGHVRRCDDCSHSVIAYNSCRNRHCPRCQGEAARAWLAQRQAELLPVAYYHLVFTLPATVAAIAFQNKAVVYDILFKAASQTLATIAADPKHLGAKLGLTAVLHTWGSAMTHHPHVHIIATGGGLSPDGTRWIACKPGFFLPVRVLSRLFRRLFLDKLRQAYADGALSFFNALAPLANESAFAACLAPLRRCEWVVYAKRPFGGPEAVLAYLSRYTHRVAISNSRLLAMDHRGVTFRWKDYRARDKLAGDNTAGAGWIKTMTLDPDEFIRRFLLHVLPPGFHRIRHTGFLASPNRASTIARIREMIGLGGIESGRAKPAAEPAPAATINQDDQLRAEQPRDDPATHPPCPCCGGRMRIIERFGRGASPKTPQPRWPAAAVRIDTS
jgi:Putative transposase/Transposase zinc-binding domain